MTCLSAVFAALSIPAFLLGYPGIGVSLLFLAALDWSDDDDTEDEELADDATNDE